ncbi:MAG: hypothetical protein II847_05365 [Ruminobacter sp.]|uniref:hypothetical protein n=1 Tax=Ruminobacter sp. TaxID=2774296 RepID=UPI0025799AF2|nr:hypothetical protein [Ruminobacter sp.]MBQ3775537.1 hypothetical protein [Ruminobacter sp.]
MKKILVSVFVLLSLFAYNTAAASVNVSAGSHGVSVQVNSDSINHAHAYGHSGHHVPAKPHVIHHETAHHKPHHHHVKHQPKLYAHNGAHGHSHHHDPVRNIYHR